MIDICIIILLALSIFLGYKKGLIGAILKIVTFFIAIIVALILAKPISSVIIEQTTIDDSIQQVIVKNFVSQEENQEKQESEENNMPKVLQDYIENYYKEVEKSVTQAKDEIIVTVAKEVTGNIIYIVVMIILFFVTKIALFFVKIIAQWIAKIPVIKQFDKLGGVLYGTLRGILVIYVILAIISFISPMIPNAGILEAINSSILGSMLYNNNLILKIFF